MEGLRAKHGQILHPSRHSGTTSPESTMPRFVDNPNSWCLDNYRSEDDDDNDDDDDDE